MNIKLIDIPKIVNKEGNIGVVEKNILPYDVKRVYYLFDIPSSAKRGGHAHKEQLEFLISISGSFDVIIKNQNETKTITLNKPDKGLLIGKNTWRELENFSSGAVCLVLASDVYDEDDYIRNYKSYLSHINSNK